MRGFLHLGSHKKIDSDQLACSKKGKDLYAQPREAQHVNKRCQPFLFKEDSWVITSQFCAACQVMNAYVNGCSDLIARKESILTLTFWSMIISLIQLSHFFFTHLYDGQFSWS